MTDPRGLLVLTAGGREWRLWMGMSVLAELQAKHGQGVLHRLDRPEGAPAGWMPKFAIVVDLLVGCLQRYHAEEADKYVADEIVQEHGVEVVLRLVSAGFPDQETKPGNRKARRAAAAST